MTVPIHVVQSFLTPQTRREWLAHTSLGMAGIVVPWHARNGQPRQRVRSGQVDRMAQQSLRIEPRTWHVLAQRAVDAALNAGAQYADARLTRTVNHSFVFGNRPSSVGDIERIGVGIRTLVNGYWGFVACPSADFDEVVQLAHDAVAQARTNAAGVARTVEMGHYPAATGTWETPVQIDPFTVSIEEKQDVMLNWLDQSIRLNTPIYTLTSRLNFARQERVVVTSDGSSFTQIQIESGGTIECSAPAELGGTNLLLPLHGVGVSGKGWELFQSEANIPGQLDAMLARMQEEAALNVASRPSTIGRYTFVCDGLTMASLLDKTFGLATQIDRALGYEANAAGTSFIDDPLAMLGRAQLAAPSVTITANRSAPTQLATVKWDDEGVTPQSSTLLTNGILTDCQTTREQVRWLAPYYQRRGMAERSHGYAAAPDAIAETMQHTPNLSLDPATSQVRTEDLVASVTDGYFIEGGIAHTTLQARDGILSGRMRRIQRGRLGALAPGCVVMFSTLDLWKKIEALGGLATQAVLPVSQYTSERWPNMKGQPPQSTSHSVSAVAAMITGQALVDPRKRI